MLDLQRNYLSGTFIFFLQDSELLDFFTKQLHAHLLSDRVSSGNSSSGSARELLENRVE